MYSGIIKELSLIISIVILFFFSKYVKSSTKFSLRKSEIFSQTFNSKEALRTLRLAREIGGWKLVKLEVLGDKKNLFPDMIETLKSTEVLAKEGFKVMVYCNDDPLMAKRLENSGADAIMPLAAPIGSGLGIQNLSLIHI